MRPLVVVLGISFVAGSGAVAQDTATQEGRAKLGVGLAFVAPSPIGQLTGTSTAYFPLAINRTVRLEPVIGWHHTSLRDSSNVATSPSNGLSGSTSIFLLGLGVFGTSRLGNAGTQLYYGPRGGVAWGSATAADPAADSLSESQTAWFLTAVLGGEHRIAHLSVGGEIGFSYLHIGSPSFQQRGAAFSFTVASGTTISTSGAAFVRWYF